MVSALRVCERLEVSYRSIRLIQSIDVSHFRPVPDQRHKLSVLITGRNSAAEQRRTRNLQSIYAQDRFIRQVVGHNEIVTRHP